MGDKGRTEMGMRKHSASGFKNGSGKSPNLRHSMKREAEKNEIKAKPSTCKYNSVQEIMDEIYDQ